MRGRRGPVRRAIDLRECFPDRRSFWGFYAVACGVGALVFLTASEDGSSPWFLPGFIVMLAAISWFYFRIGILSRKGFQMGRFRLEPSLWRFWFAPPRGPEREASAWILWIASCVAAVLYLSALARAMYLDLS